MDQSNDCILSARVGRGPGSTVFLARPLIKSGLAKSKSPFDPKHRLTDTTPPFVSQSAAVRVVGGAAPAAGAAAMNPLTQVKRTQIINQKEAILGIGEDASWHAKFKDSAYVYVGGVPFDLTEGDLLAIFAQ